MHGLSRTTAPARPVSKRRFFRRRRSTPRSWSGAPSRGDTGDRAATAPHSCGRLWRPALFTTGAALLVVVAAASCTADSGGVRVEGSPSESEGPRAEASVVSTAPPGRRDAPGTSNSGGREGSGSAGGESGSTDALRLVRNDPRVSDEVKEQLRKPCSGDLWPVSVAYGQLTGGPKPDAVVNVTSCADGFGVGSYVYRKDGSDTYENVFAREDPSVYAEIDDDALVVKKSVYVGEDPMCCPSGEVITTYMWRAVSFRELTRQYTDHSKNTGSEPGPETQLESPGGRASRGGAKPEPESAARPTPRPRS